MGEGSSWHVHTFELVVEALAADRHDPSLSPRDHALLGELLMAHDIARHNTGARRHAGDMRGRREAGDGGEGPEQRPAHLQRVSG